MFLINIMSHILSFLELAEVIFIQNLFLCMKIFVSFLLFSARRL